MTVLRSCCAAAAALFAFSVLACDAPSVVAIPDGATSTTEELLEVQAEVRAYMAAMEDYLDCLDQEMEQAGGEEAPAEYRSAMITRYNTAVGEMEAVAAAFNEQVAAHNAANADD